MDSRVEKVTFVDLTLRSKLMDSSLSSTLFFFSGDSCFPLTFLILKMLSLSLSHPSCKTKFIVDLKNHSILSFLISHLQSLYLF